MSVLGGHCAPRLRPALGVLTNEAGQTLLTLEDALALKVFVTGTLGHEPVHALTVDRGGRRQVAGTVYAHVMARRGVGDVDGVEGHNDGRCSCVDGGRTGEDELDELCAVVPYVLL